MQMLDRRRGSGSIAHFWRSNGCIFSHPWQLKWKPVCGSTELDLSRWLREKPLLSGCPRAIFSARQKYAFGQRGKPWQSPIGGVWVSAALPWQKSTSTPELLGIAVALALSERLERYGVNVRIKWPNDLIVAGQKLAGLLPCLVHRGDRVMLARIGIGLNVCNQVPFEGIALSDLLKPSQCKPIFWSAEVLLALDRAIDLLGKPEKVCSEVAHRLWAKSLRDPKTGDLWKIDSLDIDGALVLRQGSRLKKLTRW